MLEKKMIFSKRYEKITDKMLADESDEELEDKMSEYNPYPTGEDFLRHLEEDSEIVLIPERVKRKDLFISLAKKLSEDYEIDTDIYERNGGIIVDMYIEPSLFSGHLKNLLTQLVVTADDISFFTPKEGKNYVLVALEYYTHELFLSGRKMRNLS